MSIETRMVSAQLLKPQESKGVLETTTTYAYDRNIMVSFSLLTGTTTNSNNTIYSSSTHTALTKDRGVTKKHRLQYGDDVYTITYVNNDSKRYSVLFLTLVQ